MTNVIPFRPRQTYPAPQEPDVVIEIYERPNRNGFDWVVTGQGEPPTQEQLSDYLGDMFLSLHPDRPGIRSRLAAFFRRITHIGDDK